MNEELINEQLKNLYLAYVSRGISASDGLDYYCEEHSRILDSSRKMLSWNAYLQHDLWRLREAVDAISLAYDDWKNGNIHYIGAFCLNKEKIWNPESISSNEYRKSLYTLVESGIVAKQIESTSIPEENDYWIRPIDLLFFCQNKNTILPKPFSDFIFIEWFRKDMARMSLEFAEKAYAEAMLVLKKIPLSPLGGEPIDTHQRHDQRQMAEFLKNAGKIWAKSVDKHTGIPIDKPALLALPEVKKLRMQLTDAKGAPAKYCDAYIKRKLSSVAPNQSAREGGRRKYAKSKVKM